MPRLPVDLKSAAAWAVKLPIRAYRYTLSPMIGHVCRFHPTCSVYALEAIDTHGAAKGLWLTIRRLARCHPITWLGGGSGIDPVPSVFSSPVYGGGASRAEASEAEGGADTPPFRHPLPPPSRSLRSLDTSPVNGGEKNGA